MIQKRITVSNPKGIHARPSTLIVQTALKYDSRVTLSLGDIDADAREIMQIISLGAFCGDEIEVTVEGGDEATAMQALESIFALNFNDE